MVEASSIEYRGVRVDLANVHPATRTAMLREAQAWIDRGQRQPLLTVRSHGVNVPEAPDQWPATVTGYRRNSGDSSGLGEPTMSDFPSVVDHGLHRCRFYRACGLCPQPGADRRALDRHTTDAST